MNDNHLNLEIIRRNLRKQGMVMGDEGIASQLSKNLLFSNIRFRMPGFIFGHAKEKGMYIIYFARDYKDYEAVTFRDGLMQIDRRIEYVRHSVHRSEVRVYIKIRELCDDG